MSLIKRLNMKMYAKIYIISRHCSYFGHVDLIKHEAEVDPQHLLRHHLSNASCHLVALMAVPVAPHAAVTVKHECTEVTTKYGILTPLLT